MSNEASDPLAGRARPGWRRLEAMQKLRDLLQETAPTQQETMQRLRRVERDVILPVKAAFILVLAYYFYLQPWYEMIPIMRWVALETFRRFFVIYAIVSVVVAVVLWNSHRLGGRVVQWVIFSSNFLDGLFIAALTYVTGGVDSLVFWLFPGLVVRNALSSPLARPQLILNGSMIVCYLLACWLDVAYPEELLDVGEFSTAPAERSLLHIFRRAAAPEGMDIEIEDLGEGQVAQPILIRAVVLVLWTTWCYGVQVLLEKQRRAQEEAKESAVRQEQLRAAGRLAAEIAHQIKNPLGIINTLAYSMQEAARQQRAADPDQLGIIRDEVAKADSIITRLMGYAQLAEGQVERLSVEREVDRALQAVFPAGASYTTRIEKRIAPNLPPLLMQRGHLEQILENVLLNAREALKGGGTVAVEATADAEETVRITITDNGPGISSERIERIFEPYVTSKSKGSGLGLAITRHNIEIYGGSVRAESELGKGARFILEFPTRTFMKLKT